MQKFDRQTRLWGLHGQKKLSESHICIINITFINCEILKNLVLAGVGKISIFVKENPTQNFYNGNNNVKSILANISTMNPDTSINLLENLCIDQYENFDFIISDYFNCIDFIINSWSQSLPLLLSYNKGMMFFAIIIHPETNIIERNVENEILDLRVTKPFERLKNFLKINKIDEIPIKDLAKYPYIIGLIRFWEEFNTTSGSHNKSITFAVKNQFKDYIKNECNTNCIVEERESIQEFESDCIKAVNTMINPPFQIPQNIKSIFEDPRSNIDFWNAKTTSVFNEDENTKFWWKACALKSFYEKYGSLPIKGQLPDMNCDSHIYIQLLQLYKEQFAEECTAFLTIFKDLFGAFEVLKYVDTFEIEAFCKHAKNIQACPGMSYDECQKMLSDSFKNEIKTYIPDDTNSSNFSKFDFLFLHKLFTMLNHNPKYSPLENLEVDDILTQISEDLGSDGCFFDKNQYDRMQALVREGIKYEMIGEIEAVSSIAGGILAQQCIKFITKQYIPLQGALFYSAIDGTLLTVNSSTV